MIKVLSNDTIQKIAAGEVVERPASIVKELVENSIDAKATEIIVEIKNGGKSYIKVSDNGSGVAKDDIELAFERHATSKISNFDDLYKILSMGFRGEALSSIISVSNVVMKSRFHLESTGTEIIYNFNELVSKKSIGMNVGTTIEVFDLFKHVPVREKFLQSDLSETNKITALIYSFAIGHPEISFTYIRDNREVVSTNSKQDKIVNFRQLFGNDFVNNSIQINAKSDNYKIYGSISNNKYYKGNRSMQFVYVNGRFVNNENIIEAIERAYFNQIPNGRFPVFELNIDVDPNLIDINIHPNKQKIRFSLGEELLSLITKTIQNALYENDRAKEVKIKEQEPRKISFHNLDEDNSYKKILDAYKPAKEGVDIRVKEEGNLISFESVDDHSAQFEVLEEFNEKAYDNNIQENFLDNELEFKSVIFNKYILFENPKENKLIVVDISQANSRLLYDQLSKENIISSQALLEPIILSLNKKEMETFLNNQDSFNDFGYEVDTISDTSIIIRAVPNLGEEIIPSNDFKLLLDRLEVEKDFSKTNISRKIASLASNKTKNYNDESAKILIKSLEKSSNMNTSPNGKSIFYNIDFETFLRILK